MECIRSRYWDDCRPLFSVIVPAYNRASTIERTLLSIVNQSEKNWEIIIVNDGSTDDTDSVVLPFLEKETHPVIYIKKSNGGVHTARNTGVREARGFFYVEIDSDDELTPDALSLFKKAWDEIPDENKPEYREVVGLCIDEKGNVCGKKFPEGINSLAWNDALRACNDTHGEHLACSITSIRKANLFPEPEGVTFYNESILWGKLALEYRSYYTNNIVRIYHTEGDDHLNTTLDKTEKKKTVQQCRNGLWECWYIIKHYDTYCTYFSYNSTLVRYLLMRRMLKMSGDGFYRNYKITGLKPFLFSIPVFFYSFIYRKNRMQGAGRKISASLPNISSLG